MLTLPMSELSDKLLSSMQPHVVLSESRYSSPAAASSLLPVKSEPTDILAEPENSPPEADPTPEIETPATGPAYIFTCYLCRRKLTSLSGLSTHMSKSHGITLSVSQLEQQLIRCDICDRPYQSSSGLRKHKLRQHGVTHAPKEMEHKTTGPVSEEKSQSDNESQNEDFNHQMEGYERLKEFYRCKLCDAVMVANSISRHLAQKHRKTRKRSLYTKVSIRDKSGKPTCGVCNLQLPSPSLIIQHLKTYHSKIKGLNKKSARKCEQCKIFFKTRYQSRKHQMKFHCNSESRSERLRFKEVVPKEAVPADNSASVPTSPDKSVTESTLQKAKKCLNQLSVCTLCSRPFKKSDHALRHIRVVHQESDPSKYLSFISAPNAVAVPRCHICEITFMSWGGAYRHYRVNHRGSKPAYRSEFYCNICKVPFKNSFTLNNHMTLKHKIPRMHPLTRRGKGIAPSDCTDDSSTNHIDLTAKSNNKLRTDTFSIVLNAAEVRVAKENWLDTCSDESSSESSSNAHNWLYQDSDMSTSSDSDSDVDGSTGTASHMMTECSSLAHDDVPSSGNSSESSESSDSDTNILSFKLLNGSSDPLPQLENMEDSEVAQAKTEPSIIPQEVFDRNQVLLTPIPELADFHSDASTVVSPSKSVPSTPSVALDPSQIPCLPDPCAAASPVLAHISIAKLPEPVYPVFMLHSLGDQQFSALIPVHTTSGVYYYRFSLIHQCFTESSWLSNLDGLSWKLSNFFTAPYDSVEYVTSLEEAVVSDMLLLPARLENSDRVPHLCNSAFCMLCGFVSGSISMLLKHCSEVHSAGRCDTCSNVIITGQVHICSSVSTTSYVKFIPLSSDGSATCQYICIPALMEQNHQHHQISFEPLLSPSSETANAILFNSNPPHCSIQPMNLDHPNIASLSPEPPTSQPTPIPLTALPAATVATSVPQQSPPHTSRSPPVVLPSDQTNAIFAGSESLQRSSTSVDPHDTISATAAASDTSTAASPVSEHVSKPEEPDIHSTSKSPRSGSRPMTTPRTSLNSDQAITDESISWKISNSIPTQTYLHTYNCCVCGESFNNRYLLAHHKAAAHYSCAICDQVLSDRSLWAEHLRNEHSKFMCWFCDDVFDDSGTIESHILEAHTDTLTGTVRCSYCNNQPLAPHEIVSHTLKHNKVDRMSCSTCGDDLPTDAEAWVLEHLLNHFPHFMVYTCLVCKEGFLEPAALRAHLRRCKSFSCQNCCFSAETKTLYQLYHKKCLSGSSGGLYPLVASNPSISRSCKVCWVKVIEMTIKEHCDKDHSDLNFQCETCGQKFEFAHQLKFHQPTHQRWCYHVCPTCLLVTKLSRRKHHSSLPVEVVACQRSDCLPILSTHPSPSKLSSLSRFKAPTFTCPQCSFRCTFLAALNKHISLKHVSKITLAD